MRRKLFMRVGDKAEEQLYGELSPVSWNKIKEVVDYKPGDVILDIGSGSCNFLSHVANKCPDSKVIGVELLKHRHEYAVEKYDEIKNLTLINDRFPCELPFKPDIVIIHGCAFPKHSMDEIIKALPKGCRVISNSKFHRTQSKLKFKVPTSYSLSTHFYSLIK